MYDQEAVSILSKGYLSSSCLSMSLTGSLSDGIQRGRLQFRTSISSDVSGTLVLSHRRSRGKLASHGDDESQSNNGSQDLHVGMGMSWLSACLV